VLPYVLNCYIALIGVSFRGLSEFAVFVSKQDESRLKGWLSATNHHSNVSLATFIGNEVKRHGLVPSKALFFDKDGLIEFGKARVTLKTAVDLG
jgi:hypothetical protein